MLIDLVRDSVLRCFCHTCTVNTAITGHQLQKKPFTKKNNKPRHKQPKKRKRYHATEIRCEEKSRGGMCYEVILASPVTTKPIPKYAPGKSITSDDINLKLQLAEERRKLIESSKVAFISDSLIRLEEASRKRDEYNASFIYSTQTALEEKFESISLNREEYLKSIKSKLTDHLKGIDQVRNQLEEQSEELKEAISQKMVNAQENRDENMRRVMDKLKEHDDRAHNVKFAHEEAVQEIKMKIRNKLESAERNRKIKQMQKLEALKEHEKRRDLVRKKKMIQLED